MFASADEHIGLDRIGGVCIEWPGARVAVRLDRGRYLRGQLSYRVLQISEFVLRIQPHRGVGSQHLEAMVDHRIVGQHQHFHIEAICHSVQLLEADQNHGVVSRAHVRLRKRTRCVGQPVVAEQRKDVGNENTQDDADIEHEVLSPRHVFVFWRGSRV
ncbi:Uncharacterised protein [Mycobacterium tuberculosis]|nr:Uncharacterised protein [Mycobacterium tuberculosis]